MTIDVVMLSDAKTSELMVMTHNAIKSIIRSEPKHHFHIILFEKQEDVDYKFEDYGWDVTVLQQDGEFNYNRYMNEGTSMGSAEWVIWANNDIVVESDFMTEIMRLSDKYSTSSWCCNDGRLTDAILPELGMPEALPGYVIRYNLNGWFIVARRIIWDVIGGLDETHSFWYSDDAYAAQLQRYNFRHALATGTLVRHLHSKTLFTLPLEEQLILTEGTIPE